MLVVGLVVGFVATGEVSLVGAVSGVVLAFLGGIYGTDIVIEGALLVSLLRDSIANVASVWWLVGPALIAFAWLLGWTAAHRAHRLDLRMGS